MDRLRPTRFGLFQLALSAQLIERARNALEPRALTVVHFAPQALEVHLEHRPHQQLSRQRLYRNERSN